MIKIALPAGELRKPVAAALNEVGLRVAGYGEGSRNYRLKLEGADTPVRVFRPRDIPIQISLGSYDLGICTLHWVDEFLTRFPRDGVVKVRNLGIGLSRLYVAAAPDLVEELGELNCIRGLRIASEYPNLAEAFAMASRLPGYKVLPVWGAADGYPPEDADLALITAANEQEVVDRGLVPLHLLLESEAWLIANRESLKNKELSPILAPLMEQAHPLKVSPPKVVLPRVAGLRVVPIRKPVVVPRETVRLALPDGHLQKAAVAALERAGLVFTGYDLGAPQRRPQSQLAGLEIKVVRPQDMPQLVAAGSFDMAVSGRDCLRDHLYRFPSSPVEEIVDLELGQFDLSAVVSDELSVNNIEEALEHWRLEGRSPVCVASEFVNIADHYARSCRLWHYRVIPIAGASEGFLPEDADLLIEGTETGQTLAENNLKVIDVIFRSTLCLIACPSRQLEVRRKELFDRIVTSLS